MANIDRDLPPIDRVRIYMEHVERHRQQVDDSVAHDDMCAALAHLRDLKADANSAYRALTGLCYQEARR